MSIQIRVTAPSDIEACAFVMRRAFTEMNRAYGYANIELPGPQAAHVAAKHYIGHPGFYGIAAHSGENIVGCAFVDERSEIPGVVFVGVDPNVQGRRVGRQLMQAVLERASDAASVRLLQYAFDGRSLALCSSLGFRVREPIVLLVGRIATAPDHTYRIRLMHESDLSGCAALSEKVFGFRRVDELRDAVRTDRPFVALRDGRIVAYMARPKNGHAVAITDAAMTALLSGMCEMLDGPLSLLVPARHFKLFHWCLAAGMRIEKPLTLMVLGEYQEPTGCYLTSLAY